MFRFDESRPPLYVVRISGPPSLADVEAIGRELMRMLERRAPYALVWDIAEADFPTREVISRTMVVTKKLREYSRDHYETVTPPIPVYVAYKLTPRLAKLVHFIERMLPESQVQSTIHETFEGALVAAEAALERFGARRGARPTR